MRHVIQLHRPWGPDPLAESIQVVHAGHALAAHRATTVLMRASRPTTASQILSLYGLPARSAFDLRVLPKSGTASSMAFWANVTSWWLHSRGGGIAMARTPRYALRLLGADPRHRVVLEVHGLNDPLLAKALSGCRGVVTNSEGTARGVRELGYPGPMTVLANAARGGGPHLVGPGDGIGYVGSVRPQKGLDVLGKLSLERSVVMVTPDREAALALEGKITVEDAIPPADVPARLARFQCLVVPVGRGTFGEQETCPLKLFDALASGRPVVVADSPAFRGIAPTWVPRFTIGDVGSLRRAIDAATSAQGVAQFTRREAVRTWQERGTELDVFLKEVCP